MQFQEPNFSVIVVSDANHRHSVLTFHQHVGINKYRRVWSNPLKVGLLTQINGKLKMRDKSLTLSSKSIIISDDHGKIYHIWLSLAKKGARLQGLKNSHMYQIGCFEDCAVYMTGDCFIQDIHNSPVNYPEMEELRGADYYKFRKLE